MSTLSSWVIQGKGQECYAVAFFMKKGECDVKLIVFNFIIRGIKMYQAKLVLIFDC